MTYLDDIYILSPELTPSLPTIVRALGKSPITLNLTKSSKHAIEFLKVKGLKALGTYLGPLRPRRDFLKA